VAEPHADGVEGGGIAYDPYAHPGLFHALEPILAKRDESGQIVHDESGHVQYILPPAIPAMLVVVLLLAVLARLATRRMARRPRPGLQMVAELAYGWFAHLCRQIIGPEGDRFVPLVGSLFVFILCMNWLGVVPGMMAPTTNLNVTAGLALTVFVATQVYGLRAHGLGYFRHFADGPWWLWWLIVPIHVVGELARPLSLSFRLFGNIFGEDTAVGVFIVLGAAILKAVYLPLPLHLPMVGFALFGGAVQALIFATLTAVYIGGAVQAHEEHG
jgi:F-type H+-transporting ATPase subunit a